MVYSNSSSVDGALSSALSKGTQLHLFSMLNATSPGGVGILDGGDRTCRLPHVLNHVFGP